jgi:undecaprenyl-diphosphatase
MEDILRAVALGVIRGLTEFLPISSSGHLIVARELFGWEFAYDLTFDVALHLGTTAAVIAFFWSEWLAMLRSGWQWLSRRDSPVDDPGRVYDTRLLIVLAIGSIPAAIAAVFFEAVLDVRSPIIVGIMLIVFAVVLYAADRFAGGSRELGGADAADAAWVGGAQAVSLVPGGSRSGVTISAAMARGFSREQAARFSFMLGHPRDPRRRPSQERRGGFRRRSGRGDRCHRRGRRRLCRCRLAEHPLPPTPSPGLLQTGTLMPFVVYRLIAGTFIVLYFSL